MTNYSNAVDDFRKTNDYKRSVAAMEEQGMKQPYIDNILLLAFAAGWNATGRRIYPIKSYELK